MSTYAPIKSTTTDNEIEQLSMTHVEIVLDSEFTGVFREVVAAAVEAAIHYTTARAAKRVEAALFSYSAAGSS